MDDFLGEIRLMAGLANGQPPRGWALCNGKLLQIQQNAALYSLLGTAFGGDGRTTFALPDMRGRVFIGRGVNTDGGVEVNYVTGNSGGSETVTVTTTSMPPHTHTMVGDATMSATPVGKGNYLAVPRDKAGAAQSLYGAPTALVPLNKEAVTTSGGDASHANMEPYLAVSYCICTDGVYPPRP